MTSAYRMPDPAGLLSLAQFERNDYFGSKKKMVKWLVDYFAPRYGITKWTKKSFMEKELSQVQAIWAQYYELDKTAVQIARELQIPEEDRQNLSIGDWPNPHLHPTNA